MAFSSSFTGKDTAVRLEGGGTQAQEGLNALFSPGRLWFRKGVEDDFEDGICTRA